MAKKYSPENYSLREEECGHLQREIHSSVWPMLYPDESGFKWHWTNGESLDTTGMIYKGHHHEIDTYETVFTKGRKFDWVKHLGCYEIIEHGPSGKWDVAYNTTIVGFGVNDRDFITLLFNERGDDGSILAFFNAYPKPHPKDPSSKDSKRVRGKYLPSGQRIRPIPNEPNKCHFTFINNFDLKGYLPRKLISMFTGMFMVNYGRSMITECNRISQTK